MMNRIYLDYNATAPLAKNFVAALAAGKIPEGNASSVHGSGKAVQKQVNVVTAKLYDFFNLSVHSHQLLFHSGATEALNTFLNQKPNTLIAYFKSDHPSMKAFAELAKKRGLETLELPVNTDGSLDEAHVVERIQNASRSDLKVIIHFTHVNSETGVIWDLEIAQRIKEKTKCLVYVDCVQSPAKGSERLKLPAGIDVYTFSGHKFGALKGVGFSFFKKSFEFSPLVVGGGQQNGARSGTLNTHGIFSLEYALEDLDRNFNKQSDLKRLKEKIISKFKSSAKIKVIENSGPNTICLVHENLRADIMLVHFDLIGLDVSSGSACSSGSVSPSETLLAMGFGALAANSIRLSLGIENVLDEDEILGRLDKIMSKL